MDDLLLQEFRSLQPHYNIPDTGVPYCVSGNLTLLAPSTAVISNMLQDVKEQPELDTITIRLGVVNIN
jgi:hypothetical protein